MNFYNYSFFRNFIMFAVVGTVSANGMNADQLSIKDKLPNLSMMSWQSDYIFLPHSAQFQSKATALLIKGLKMIRNADPNLVIHIIALSDTIPNNREQKLITNAQAEAVASYLWSQGVSVDRMIIQGVGSKYPVGDTHYTTTNALNRRIEVLLIPAMEPQRIYPEGDSQ